MNDIKRRGKFEKQNDSLKELNVKNNNKGKDKL